MKERFLDGNLIVKIGDITAESVDAIVNAANWTLLGGGGVDGAIHSKGGPAILEECRRIRSTTYPNGLPAGKAVLTKGGDLPAKYVIHTVGPIYGNHAGDEPDLLADCYRNSVALALEHRLQSIAFPSISTGAFSYPKHEAARIVGKTVKDILMKASIEIRLVYFSQTDLNTFFRHSGLTT